MMDAVCLKNIMTTLSCRESDVVNIEPITLAHTNAIFAFDCKGERYIYRAPGENTSGIIDRKQEARIQRLVDTAGIDGTTIVFDETTGWKISRFVRDTRPFEYENAADVSRAVSLLRRLHAADLPCDKDFLPFNEAVRFELLFPKGYTPRLDHLSLKDDMSSLAYLVESDAYRKMLCHNDASDNNFLTTDSKMYLIDWEYAALGDPYIDLASFICGTRHTHAQVVEILSLYNSGVTLSEETLTHAFACIALCAYFWLIWGLYQEGLGAPERELIDIWFDYAREYGALAVRRYFQ